MAVLTWAAARTKIRSDLWRSASGVPDDVCDRALHDALTELEGERRWLWLENVTTTIALVAAARSLPAIPTLSAITSIAYFNGNGGYDALTPLPLAQVHMLSRGATGGTPTYYALRSDMSVDLDTQAAIGSQFEVIGTWRTPELLDDAIAGDPNTTLQKQQSAVIARAAAIVSLGYRRDEESAARFDKIYQNRLLSLMDTEDRARGDSNGGFIQPDTGYQDAAWGTGASNG